MALTAEERKDLEHIIEKDFFENTKAFDDGRRNDDAVDFSIICHCLGVDPMDKFRELARHQEWTATRLLLTQEHMERVEPYLDKWGEEGTMEAMAYAIDY